MQSKQGDLNSLAAQMATDALNHAKGAIHSKSPSRDFAEQVGAPMGQGIVVGLQSQSSAVNAAAAALAAGATTAAASSMAASASASPASAANSSSSGGGSAGSGDLVVHMQVDGQTIATAILPNVREQLLRQKRGTPVLGLS